jgi:hypothetical protein
MFGQLAGLALGVGSQLMGQRADRRNNPSRAASPHLAAIPGAARPYYDPFINVGNEAIRNTPAMLGDASALYLDPSTYSKTLPNQYEQMAHNPGAFMEALMQGYNPSTGYKFKQKQMMDAMRNSASSGGFAGTPFDQQQQAETTQGLLGADMQEYLQNLLGISQAGLQGKENRILGHERGLERILNHQENNINRGYNASSAFGDLLANVRGSQASNAYAGAVGNGENAHRNVGGWNALGNQAINMFGGIKGSAGNRYGSGHYF